MHHYKNENKTLNNSDDNNEYDTINVSNNKNDNTIL